MSVKISEPLTKHTGLTEFLAIHDHTEVIVYRPETTIKLPMRIL